MSGKTGGGVLLTRRSSAGSRLALSSPPSGVRLNPYSTHRSVIKRDRDPARDRIRILVAYDDVWDLETIVDRLERDRAYRFEVHKVATPSRLMEAIDEVKPDILVLDDCFAPSRSDFKVLLTGLTDRYRYLPVIVLSSLKESEKGDAGLWSYGASEILKKSAMWEDEALPRAISQVVLDVLSMDC